MMMNKLTSTIVSGCLLIAAACPALGQAEEDRAQREIELELKRAMAELLREQIERQREEIQRIEDAEQDDAAEARLRERERMMRERVLEERRVRLVQLQDAQPRDEADERGDLPDLEEIRRVEMRLEVARHEAIAIREQLRALELHQRQLQEAGRDEEAAAVRDQISLLNRHLQEVRRPEFRLQFDEPHIVFGRGARGEPAEIDAKPIVNPWAARPREQAIAGLNDADFSVRESAEAHLLRDNTLDKAALKRLIKDANSPEQRQRLLRIAEHHMLREMRERDFGPGADQPGDFEPDLFGRRQARSAAVGYSYEPVLAQDNPQARLPGVEVITTMPGFPGHAHLRRGDIVVQINGQGLPIHTHDDDITRWVQWQINSKQAGEQISFTVLRNGELLAIDMVCAEGRALDQMYSSNALAASYRRLQPYRSEWLDVRDELAAEMPKPKTLTPVVQGAE